MKGEIILDHLQPHLDKCKWLKARMRQRLAQLLERMFACRL